MNKAVLTLLVLIVLVALGGAFLFYSMNNNNNTTPEQPDTSNNPNNQEPDLNGPSDTITADGKNSLEYIGYTLTANYLGNNSWEYEVTGELINGCYVAKTDALVAESFPEQVTVSLTVEMPDPDAFCTQAIVEFTETGEFSASESAIVRFDVEEE